jgi:hypothetical protein
MPSISSAVRGGDLGDCRQTGASPEGQTDPRFLLSRPRWLPLPLALSVAFGSKAGGE